MTTTFAAWDDAGDTWDNLADTWDAGKGPPHNFPKISIQVAFQNNPFDANPFWIDITKYTTGFTTTMGRQHELQQVGPSTCNITLTNQDGRFSPWNTGSPYYVVGSVLGLVPGHPVRIQATWLGITHNVFYGYVKGWVPAYGMTKSDITLQCYDVLALLNLNTMDTNTYSIYPTGSATNYWKCGDLPGALVAAPTVGGPSLVPSSGLINFG